MACEDALLDMMVGDWWSSCSVRLGSYIMFWEGSCSRHCGTCIGGSPSCYLGSLHLLCMQRVVIGISCWMVSLAISLYIKTCKWFWFGKWCWDCAHVIFNDAKHHKKKKRERRGVKIMSYVRSFIFMRPCWSKEFENSLESMMLFLPYPGFM